MRALTVALVVGLRAGMAAAQGTTECAAAKPEWIWCDDFEQDRKASYFEVSERNGSFVRTGGVGRGESFGMRARYAAGQVDAGALHLAFGKTPQAAFRPAGGDGKVFREIWWRVWVKYGPGWTGGGGVKMSRAIVFSSPDTWAEAAIAHVWSGGPGHAHLVLDPASGTAPSGQVITTRYNDFSRLRWIGSVRSGSKLFAGPANGEWRCIESRARLNDPGHANGIFELWVDGRLEARRQELNWVGSYTGYGWNAVFLENYWNAGAPKAQERYFDNFVVSTRPIGCGPS